MISEKLKDISSIPEWCKDNECIKNGYRSPNPSFTYCLKTIFRIHNESGNILTHLIGSLLFVILWCYTFSCHLYKEFGLIDKLVFSGFFSGVILCLLISASFHTFMCHSMQVCRLFAKLDYCGIAVLITVCFIPWIYYGFYFSRIPKIIYLSLTIFTCFVCILVSLFDRFSEPQYRKLRALLFMCNGLSGIFPSIHWIITHEFYTFAESASPTAVKSISLLITMGSVYIIGAVFYMTKIPERYYPGKFDIWMNSHQIFHIFVITAAVIYYHSMTLIADARLNHLKHHYKDLPLFESIKEH